MMRVIMVLALTLSACGADIDGSRHRKEKDEHYETKLELMQDKSLISTLNTLLGNVVQSETMQWAYVSNGIGVPFETWAKADKICSDAGLSLPTGEQLEGEGATVSAIANIGGNIALPAKFAAYTKDVTDGKEQILRSLVCVKVITE